MLRSICVLGRQPALGLAELESLYGSANVSSIHPQIAGLNLPAAEVNFRRLGGSTRLCKVLTELPGTDWKKVEIYLAKSFPELLAGLPEGKLKLGLSAIGLPVSAGKLTASGLSLKKVIRKAGRSVRLVPNQTTDLSTAQVLHNNLTGNLGMELVAVATTHGTTLLAQTVAVQDIDSYTARDRGRPKRDARVGMLPPKLAQIIINLAASQEKPAADKVVLDPFCGTGVVLQEALLMGFSAYGTDLEARMIDYTGANLDWLDDTFDISGVNARFEQGDATSYQWDPRPFAVAAETYLGRPFTSPPSAEILAQTVSEVGLILKKFLKNIHEQLAPGTRLCLAIPAWQITPRHSSEGGNPVENGSRIKSGMTTQEFKHLPLVDQISDLGYNRVSFEHVSDENLLYFREDQIVARELLVLKVK